MNDDIKKLQFAIDKSARYHARRRAFFDVCHKAIMFLVILSGSAAFSGSLGSPAWLGLVAAILAAADLVVGFSLKARDHSLLQRRFLDLAAEIEGTEDIQPKKLAKWREWRIEIEKDEPPIYKSLNLACHNEVIIARGLDRGEVVPLRWWHKLFMHVVLFSDHDAKSVNEISGG